MNPSEKQLWMERIARALADLKKGPAYAHDANASAVHPHGTVVTKRPPDGREAEEER